MSQEAKQQYYDANSGSQQGAPHKNRNKFLLPLLLLFLITGAFGIYRLLGPNNQHGEEEFIGLVDEPQEGTPPEDNGSGNPNQQELPSSTPNKTSAPSDKRTSTNKGGTNDTGATPSQTGINRPEKIVPEPTKTVPEVIPAVEENIFVPPILPQAALESKINEINSLFSKEGRTSAEKTINEILDAMAPGAKIYHRKPGGRAIPLPQSLKSYLNEVAFLYENTKVSIEGFQYDPRTGKIIGLTINDPY